jgi:signal transduction histidine kinase
MFTPNFTTKSSGMGLGLSIVRKYVETAGGRIWFESVADTGTAFFVELPLKYTVERRT